MDILSVPIVLIFSGSDTCLSVLLLRYNSMTIIIMLWCQSSQLYKCILVLQKACEAVKYAADTDNVHSLFFATSAANNLKAASKSTDCTVNSVATSIAYGSVLMVCNTDPDISCALLV